MLTLQNISYTHPNKDLLTDRTDVPSNFILIGNYTIEGIDIRGSVSLDVVSGLQQLNEYKSYWIPYNLDTYQDQMITLNDSKSKALLLNDKFKENSDNLNNINIFLGKNKNPKEKISFEEEEIINLVNNTITNYFDNKNKEEAELERSKNEHTVPTCSRLYY